MTREEAIERLNIHKSTSVFVDSIAEAIDMAIEALQTDLVLCKDCIHWKADNEVFELGFCCVFPQKWVAETFFCADGERREE